VNPALTSLSVLVPVYNEEYLVAESLGRLEVLGTSPHLSRVEVIVVDDHSKDGTPGVLEAFAASRSGSRLTWRFLRHERNGGKGAAIRTALAQATCELTVIHDADLEYHPRDLLRLVRVFVEDEADAVFGSRFAGAAAVRRAPMYRHELGNKLLTFLCNLATNLSLTDMETCYKAVRTDLLRSIPIESNDFRLEPELTIKLAKRRARIHEVPISYSGRSYQEGKKIGWRDGFRALSAIVRFRISDEVYVKDAYGSRILARLSRAPKFNAWIGDIIRPFCGRRVLEIGAGIGDLTLQLVPRRTFVATDVNPLHLTTLAWLRTDRPYLSVAYCDVGDRASFPACEGGFDTVVCVNVIAYIADDVQALANIRSVLADGGRAILLVPQGPGLSGTLDEVLGHRRRYTRETLTAAAEAAGLEIEQILPFNRAGTLAWYINGRLLKRREFGLLQVKLLNRLTPLFRLLDGVLPLPPLSLVAVVTPRR
jgi:glycosyltransferase involved in cell wall biosynthesis